MTILFRRKEERHPVKISVKTPSYFILWKQELVGGWSSEDFIDPGSIL
ncbi:hypothetical protein [Thermococcus sp.]